MLLSSDWKDYELLGASNGEKLERWGDIYLLRPDPQIIWNQGDLSIEYMLIIIVVIKVEVIGKIKKRFL